MKTSSLLALASLAFVGFVAANAAPVDYKLPEETSTLKPGPNLDVAQSNCTACHSADYMKTQPIMKSKKDFWQAEVIKMIKVYGAPIQDADVPKLVEYLSTAY